MRTPSRDGQTRGETLSTVDRALSLLELLSREKSLSLTQIADRLKAGKTTVFRLATSLVERDWLTKGDDLRYSLGPAVRALAASAANMPDFKALLLPLMVELHEETQETIHLTQLEGRQIVYLHQLLSPQPVVSLATLGTRSPAHCVSPGLAQLAYLPQQRIDWILDTTLVAYTNLSMTDPDQIKHELEQVRQRGYAVNRGSYRKDVGGIGVAILDPQGLPIVGISVCMPVFRLVETDIPSLGQRLMKAGHDAQVIVQQALTM